MHIMKKTWSTTIPAVQFRVARPTNQLDKIITFYKDGLGLEIIGSFKDHAGYDGVMFGLPDADYHLEFTQHKNGGSYPPPSEDNLLVFYIPDKEARDRIARNLHEMGFPSVPPENPYWEKNGITIEDPDGWRIVLMNTNGI
jgi:catechol 2,3-dioxygenase-like lactoylglutathione lyase family enzyme